MCQHSEDLHLLSESMFSKWLVHDVPNSFILHASQTMDFHLTI